jgi:predicted molibdopterin-dependent oxidoreductase YjgC
MPEPLFRSADSSPPVLVEVTVDGQPTLLPNGMPLAAALLSSGIGTFHRSVRLDEPRGPLCLMGSCFQCVAVVDGVVNQRTCRLPVRAGMVVELRTPPLPEGAA